MWSKNAHFSKYRILFLNSKARKNKKAPQVVCEARLWLYLGVISRLPPRSAPISPGVEALR